MTDREAHLVELVDPDGTAIGSATVQDAHESPGRLHRAFSVFLIDDAGRVLLQQRAAVKTRFPLRWGNTCCGHPAPGADLAGAATERLQEEIGVGGMPLTEVGVHSYVAEDPITGRVEREYDHVLVGRVADGTQFRPDPAEVAKLLWIGVPELRDRLATDPDSYAPWLSGVTDRLGEHLAASAARAAPERSGGQ